MARGTDGNANLERVIRKLVRRQRLENDGTGARAAGRFSLRETARHRGLRLTHPERP